MSAYSEYLAALKASDNPNQFQKEYMSPVEAAAKAGRIDNPSAPTRNAAPYSSSSAGTFKSDLRNYVAPSGNVNKESQYYKAGAAARKNGTNKFGANGTFGKKKGSPPIFGDLTKDAQSAEEADAAERKSSQYYRTRVEAILGHPVNALNDEQVKQIYIDKTGDESPYLNTGSDSPYYTPTMAAIDRANAITTGDVPFSSEEESMRTRDGSAYWDANRPEVHNVNPVDGYYARYFANKKLPEVSNNSEVEYWAQSPENMVLDTTPREANNREANSDVDAARKKATGNNKSTLGMLLSNPPDFADLPNGRMTPAGVELTDLQNEALKNGVRLAGNTPAMQISGGINAPEMTTGEFNYDNPNLNPYGVLQNGGIYRAADGSYQTYSAPNTASPNLTDEQAFNLDRGAAANGAQWGTARDRADNSGQRIANIIDQWQQNRSTRNALGAQTFSRDQQFDALYQALRTQGLTQADIMNMAENEELPNLSAEDNMMLYYYAMNH